MAAVSVVENFNNTSADRNAKKSFAEILSGRLKAGDVPIRPPTTYCNKPIFKDIHPALVKLGLRGPFTVGALKLGYVIINPSLEEDFARPWVKKDWSIAGRSMRLFKWSPSFTYARESAIAPVWISLPDLPLHLFAKGALYSIASLVGNPIKVDEPIANRSRPSIAKVCVEIDLLQPTVTQVIIRCGHNIFEHKIFYEDMPAFCNLCFHRGHFPEACFSNGKNQPPSRPKNPNPNPTETCLRKPTKEHVLKQINHNQNTQPFTHNPSHITKTSQNHQNSKSQTGFSPNTEPKIKRGFSSSNQQFETNNQKQKKIRPNLFLLGTESQIPSNNLHRKLSIPNPFLQNQPQQDKTQSQQTRNQTQQIKTQPQQTKKQNQKPKAKTQTNLKNSNLHLFSRRPTVN